MDITLPSSAEPKPSTLVKHHDIPIAIIGGGLGGLALAVGLTKHGINVHIYESAPVFAEIGAGVAFGVNATAALRLIDPRLFGGYMKHATFNVDPQRGSTFLTMRWGTDERKEGGHRAGDLMWQLDDKWHPERAQALGVQTRSCIHRARLLDELVALLPEGITSFGKRFQSVEERDDGTLILEFTDGTRAHVAAVIGCDGIKSKVREFVCGNDLKATYAGESAYRAMVPKADMEAALGPELAGNGHLYCGYGGYFVTYPVVNGEYVSMTAIPCDDDTAAKWDLEDWTVPTTTKSFLEGFKGWYAPLVEVFAKHHSPYLWALHTVQHNRPYFKGRVCLLGDSAHATTPHVGAGAGMAIEDAYILSNLIASVANPKATEHAFQAYDSVRRPRTQMCIRQSAIADQCYTFQLAGVGDDTDLLKDRLEEIYKWLWHEDPEAQLGRAKENIRKLGV
ncbi:hypothetical protein NX059_012476 [Plenodomus lindquistii]|nr:hypothetical protein NX059_012476 [Plenodomus lindquistii]